MRWTFEHRVPVDVERVFAFHERPAHLGLLMRGWPGFRLLHLDDRVRVGAETWCEQTVLGFIPVVMGFRHTDCDPPRRFTDELIHGPFRRFRHLHEFLGEDGATRVRDTVEISLSWAHGGERMMPLLLSSRIHAFFAFRHQAMDRLVREGLLQ